MVAKHFGLIDGEQVHAYTISAEPGGIEATVTEIGATLISVKVPDKATGTMQEVTLGFDDATPYRDGTSPYFGCIAGRCANRIAGGKFALDRKEYSLATNNGPNHLHGGIIGYDKRVWSVTEHSSNAVKLKLESADGEEGYPGALTATVVYSVPDANTLKIEYSAVCTAPTLCNLTNHTYWNLADGGKTSVADHEIEMRCDFYTPVDETSIPTGEVRKVSGAMDLTKRARIGAGLDAADNGMGYDHNYCVSAPVGGDGRAVTEGLRAVARVWEPRSGRFMSVYSDQPGVQFYTGSCARSPEMNSSEHGAVESSALSSSCARNTHARTRRSSLLPCTGNYLDGVAGRGGTSYGRNHGFCLETQTFPDAVNRPHFPSPVLRPDERYTHVTVHDFGCSPGAPPFPFV